ncbi:potassium transporter Kup [Pedobacter ginsengisoli]|uniref:Probable potassium transport system protein Kup n=1 Tax=Pedobacter ginsengisoli TaxID=363852 RepID=A0A2D1U4M8_9SPHI|nr:KUP/HAK/KT family potassium transporter [Pedobacter ginsengisoli]ATP56484.1 potassium transporter Kup [Pedobacter ginsengisoli]
MGHHKHIQKLSAAGLLISLGIIYGDIGTSPLYVFKAIIGDRLITQDLILGGLSCIVWTLTLQTTIKYVVITLQADNKGEGGIFSLFSLVKRKAKWLIIPAMVGGAALLADGIMTPAVTVSAAIEGLGLIYQDLPTVPIVLAIIIFLFGLQQFGTSLVGKAFGPIMWLWFTMIAVLGFVHIMELPIILKAINPYYAYHILTTNPEAFLIIGAVFLCTTGAEALYSDLGHCGRSNIRISWIYVKICLILNYMGQGVWLWNLQGTHLGDVNPFYHLMPDWFLIYGIAIATVAAAIASQALISGSFTLIAEAVRLNLWPKVKINYPSEQKGQLYVPSMNWILMVGCIIVVLIFQKSVNMEAAYGLSITVAMLMTTILVSVFLLRKKVPKYLIGIFLLIYGIIELTFLAGNAAKILHGGWFTLILGITLFSVMWTWHNGRRIRNRYMKFVDIQDFYPLIRNISADKSIAKYSSNLVYLTSANFNTEIESSVIYSIIQKHPKRADVYWLLHVDVTDEPYTLEYEVDQMIPGKLIRIDFRLGFRVEQRVNALFRKVVEELVHSGEIDITSKYESLKAQKIPGDFRFVVLEKIISNSNSLKFIERVTMSYHRILKLLSISEKRGFGLDSSFVTVEKVPLLVDIPEPIILKRIK